MLNLTEDESTRRAIATTVARALAAAGIAEYRLPLTDYGGLPADELEAAVRAVGTWLDEGERTYVHCRAGWQRSAAVAAGVVAIRDRDGHRRCGRLRPPAQAVGRSAAAPARGSAAVVGRAARTARA